MPDCINCEGIKIDNPFEIWRKYNNYFVSIGKRLSDKIRAPNKLFSDYWMERSATSLFVSPTNIYEVTKTTLNLKIKTSSGHDNINNILLKKLVYLINTALVQIFNKSLESGIFPKRMKMADVVPVFKMIDIY